MNNLEKFKDLSIEELNQELIHFCKMGDLETIQYLISSNELNQHANYFNYKSYNSNIANLLLEIVVNEDFDILTYLINFTQLKSCDFTSTYLSMCLNICCAKDRLDSVKFLLTSPDLSKHANINYNNFGPLKYACKKNNWKIIEYLVASPELKEKAFIHRTLWSEIDSNNINLIKYLLNNVSNPYLSEALEIVFVQACQNGNLDTVKLVVTSKELKANTNIHSCIEEAFCKALRAENKDILQYLIFDLEIEKTRKLKDIIHDELYMGKSNIKEVAQQVNNWFILREVNKQLSQELVIEKNHQHTKVKL